MTKMEWIREALAAWPSPEYLRQREAAGWRLVAVEWEREAQVEPAAASAEAARREQGGPSCESGSADVVPAGHARRLGGFELVAANYRGVGIARDLAHR